MYEGRSINKLQNGAIPSVLRFVGNNKLMEKMIHRSTVFYCQMTSQ